jgi:hypothetical protein
MGNQTSNNIEDKDFTSYRLSSNGTMVSSKHKFGMGKNLNHGS